MKKQRLVGIWTFSSEVSVHCQTVNAFPSATTADLQRVYFYTVPGS